MDLCIRGLYRLELRDSLNQHDNQLETEVDLETNCVGGFAYTYFQSKQFVHFRCNHFYKCRALCATEDDIQRFGHICLDLLCMDFRNVD